MSVEVKQKYIFFGPEIIQVRTHGSEYRITVNKKSQTILILNKDGKKTEVCFGSESEFVKSFQDINKRHNLKNDYNAKTIRTYTPDELKILAQFELMLACLHPVRCYCLDAIIEPLLSVMRSSEQDIYAAYEAFARSYIDEYTKYDVPLEVEKFVDHQSTLGICDW